MSENESTSNRAPSGPRDRITNTLANLEIERDRVGLWVVAFVFFVTAVYVGWRYVGTFVLGLFVYYVTRPVFQRIHTRIESRTIAVAVSLVTVALPVLLIVGWTLVIAFQVFADVFASGTGGGIADVVAPYVDLPTLVATANEFVRTVVADPTRLTELEVSPALEGVIDAVVSSLGALVNVGLHAFIVLILAFYLLRDDYRIAGWARRVFVPEDTVLDTYFTTVDTDLKNVYFGNILNALLTGLIGSVTYVTLNLIAPDVATIPQAALVGLLAGAASLIPVIGIKLVTWPVGLYLLVRVLIRDPSALWFPVLFFVVSFVIVDYIPDQLLRPYVSGRTLHVGAVMLAYTLGPLLFGWYGIFLGPLVLVVVFEFGRIVVPWLFGSEPVDLRPLTEDVGQPPAAAPTAPAEAGGEDADVEDLPVGVTEDRRGPPGPPGSVDDDTPAGE